jgi:hypothetical protein
MSERKRKAIMPQYAIGAGRPCLYDEKQADEICDRPAAGESLRAICQDAGINERTVRHWVIRDVNG